jgi:phage-related minor tail protein
MANKIKGLIVEIGGNTAPLEKALQDVNKKSRDLSSELGQINKLLKFDPGNADLLAQKQKVLAEAVETTSEKLDKLKEAEKQVQKQFEKGEVSEEQVRELQREIIATEKKPARNLPKPLGKAFFM